MTSSPASLTHFTLSYPVLSKILSWWSKAKRHAVQHFWGPRASSVPLILIASVCQAHCFVHSDCPNLPKTGNEARIRLCGRVNEDTGQLYFSTESPWHLDMNDLYLTYNKSDKQKTCLASSLGSRMFRLDGEFERLDSMAKQIWEYFVIRYHKVLTKGHINYLRWFQFQHRRQPLFWSAHTADGLQNHRLNSLPIPELLLLSFLRRINFH